MTDVVLSVVSLALLFAAGWCGGRVAARAGQPPIVGELLAGIVLGPTLAGRFAPIVFELAIPTGTAGRVVAAVTRIALLAFVFGVGLSADRTFLRKRASSLLPASLASFAIPCVAGAALGFGVGMPSERAAFLGVALSVSALPVIARTLSDIGLGETRFGVAVLGTVVITDLLAWTALGLLVATVRPQIDTSDLARLCEDTVVLAFVLALLLPSRIRDRLVSIETNRTIARIQKSGSTICFVALGAGVDLVAELDPGFAVAVLVVATVSKGIGGVLGARALGFERTGERAFAVALNARGAMEIVMATAGVGLGLADAAMHATLLVLAIVTSMAAGPILRRMPMRDLDSDRRGAQDTALDGEPEPKAL